MTTEFDHQSEQDLAQLLRVRDSYELTPTLQAYLDELLERRKFCRERAAGMELVRLACLRLDDEERRERQRAELAAADAASEASRLAMQQEEQDQRERVAAQLGCSVDELDARLAAMTDAEAEAVGPNRDFSRARDLHGVDSAERRLREAEALSETMPSSEEEYLEMCARLEAEAAEQRRAIHQRELDHLRPTFGSALRETPDSPEAA